MKKRVVRELTERIKFLEQVVSDKNLSISISNTVHSCIKSLESGGKIIFSGNGGSASDSEHLSAELVGRMNYDRGPLKSIALSSNVACITAIANDYTYEEIFTRQLEAIGRKEDCLIAISTSGKSINIIDTVKKANSLDMTTICFTGQQGKALAKLCQHSIILPSQKTPLIQEGYMAMGHILCSLIEKHFFPKN